MTELTIEDPAERMAEVKRSIDLIDGTLVAKRAERKELNAEIKRLVTAKETYTRVHAAYARAIKSAGGAQMTLADTNGDTDGTP